jgi:hypothetical protein
MVLPSRIPGTSRRTLLAAFLLYVLAVLPTLGASHQHEEGPSHETCQLCLVQGQVYAPSAPPVLPAASAILLFRIPQDTPQALQALPVVHASRGPPSA